MTGLEGFTIVYALNVALLIVVGAIIRVEYRRQSPALIFWLVNLAFYVLPAFFDPPNHFAILGPLALGVDLTKNLHLLIRAHAFALSFSVLYLLTRLVWQRNEKTGYLFAHPEVLRRLGREDRNVRRFVWALAALSVVSLVLGVAAIVIPNGLSGLLSATYQSYRLESEGGLKLISQYLVLTAGCGVYFAWRTRQRAAMVVCLVSVVGVFLLGRSRQLLLPALVPFGIEIIYRSRGFRRVGLVALGIVGLYSLTLFLQAFRYRGGLLSGIRSLADVQLYASFAGSLEEGGGYLGLRKVYYFFMDDQWHREVERLRVMPGQTYVRMLLLPVPSPLTGGLKPPDFDETLYNVFYDFPGAYRGTLFSFFFGDAYGNFGWLGILLGVPWAIGVHLLNLFLGRWPPLLRTVLAVLATYCAVMMGAGTIYNSSARFMWISLCQILMYRVVCRAQRRRPVLVQTSGVATPSHGVSRA